MKDYYRCGQPKLEPSSVTLVTYDKTEMKSKTTVKFNRVEKPITFEVIDTKVEQQPLIGIDTCLDLGLFKIAEKVNAIENKYRESLIHEFTEVVTGVGEMPGEYEIQMDPSVTPVQHRPRKYL